MFHKWNSWGTLPAGDSLLVINGDFTFTPKKLPPISFLDWDSTTIEPLMSQWSN